MAALVFEKCSEDILRDVFQHKMVKSRSRMRSRMVKILDNYYFQELPQEELQRQLKDTVMLAQNIHSMDEVSAFMEKQ